jgi:hypothetical protein
MILTMESTVIFSIVFEITHAMQAAKVEQPACHGVHGVGYMSSAMDRFMPPTGMKCSL